jgi:hypothetical protein
MLCALPYACLPRPRSIHSAGPGPAGRRYVFFQLPVAFAEEDDVDETKEDSQVKQEKHLLVMDKSHSVVG